MLQIVWITVGILITLYLVLLTVFYLFIVIGLWCSREDDHKEGGRD